MGRGAAGPIGSETEVKAWAAARCEDVEQERVDGLTATLCAHAAACPKAEQCANYIETNRERMRYEQFRAQGLCVGSGVVEAGCESLVCT